MAVLTAEDYILMELKKLTAEARKTNEILDAIYTHLVDHVGKPGGPLG